MFAKLNKKPSCR